MLQKLTTSQAKYEFIAKNWGKLPVEDIAKRTKFDTPYIHILVLRMRKHGVPIPSLSRAPRRPGGRAENINYELIKQLLTNDHA